MCQALTLSTLFFPNSTVCVSMCRTVIFLLPLIAFFLCRYSVARLDPDPCWPHSVPLFIASLLLINCNTLTLSYRCLYYTSLSVSHACTHTSFMSVFTPVLSPRCVCVCILTCVLRSYVSVKPCLSHPAWCCLSPLPW